MLKFSGLENFIKLQKDVRLFLRADVSAVAETFRRGRGYHLKADVFVKEVFKQVKFSEKTKKLIMVAAKLSSEENDNKYHDNQHFLEVFSLSLVLGHHAYKKGHITETDFGNLLVSALLHDYKHDGSINGGVQYRLERISVDASRDALLKAGATVRDLKIIEAMILSTDVTKDFCNPEAVSPTETLKLYHEGAIEHVDKDLSVLEKEGVVDLALMLCDADVGSNFLNIDLLNENSSKLEKENGTPFNIAAQQFFLEKICDRRLHSDAGKEILTPYMDKTLQHCFSTSSIFARTPL